MRAAVKARGQIVQHRERRSAVHLHRTMLGQQRERALLVAEEVSLDDQRDARDEHRSGQGEDERKGRLTEASRRARASATVVLPEEGIPVTTTSRGDTAAQSADPV